MKIKHLLIVVAFAFLQACSDDDTPKVDPDAPAAIMVSSIKADDDIQDFAYSGGRISKWSRDIEDITYNATFSYPTDNTVAIYCVSVEDVFLGKKCETVYDETLTLDAEGKAQNVSGIWKQTYDNAVIKKKYAFEFIYSTDQRLERIKWTEWQRKGDGWAEDHPWTFENELVWKDGNLVKYVDYLGKSKPYLTIEYDYMPLSLKGKDIVVAPMMMVRPYYYPLQLAGMFGRISKDILSKQTYNYEDGTQFTYKYSYDISQGSVDSTIEAYYLARDNHPETKYAVSWIGIR